MELVFRQFDPSQWSFGIQALPLDQRSVGVKQQQSDGSLQNKKAFEACAGLVADMAVWSYVGPRLEDVEKALDQIRFLMQVVVHAPPRTVLGNSCNSIKQLLVDALHICVAHAVFRVVRGDGQRGRSQETKSTNR